jgi:hypothetical protein
MDAVLPQHVSLPADNSASAGDFDVYLDLYSPFIDDEIALSEANFLAPQYLHLNEHDIGNVGDYSMKNYLAGFVHSLGVCRESLEQVVFCYSFESSSGLLPQDCTRNQFYAFQLNNPAIGETSAEVSTAIVGYERRETGRPDARNIEGSQGLAHVLANSHLVQPYIVGMHKGRFNCIHDIRPTSDEALTDLISSFKKPGCYQFSMYAYRFKAEERQRWLQSRTHRAFLEHAFILHILHWNQGLRAAHERASVFGRMLKEVRHDWDAAKTQAELVFDKLGTVVSKGTRALNPDSILPLPTSALNQRDGLFRNSWGHSLGEFPKEKPTKGPSSSFTQFHQYVRRYSTTEGYRELGDFVEGCGSSSYLSAVKELTAEQRESWERAIFWATKLMSRRVQPDEEGRFGDELLGIGSDQIVLAMLFGLTRAARANVDVRVSYSGNLTNVQGGIEKHRDEFLKGIRVENPTMRNVWKGWSQHAWRWLDNNITLEWCPTKSGISPLHSFILSGLLRSTETLYKDVLLYVPGEGTPKGKRRYDSFLAKLAQLVELCAKGDSSEGELRLRNLNVKWDVNFVFGSSGTAKHKKSSMLAEICCDGVLESRERTGTGVFTSALWGLNEFFATSLRSDADDMVSGLYYVVDNKTSTIRLVLNSVGQENLK